MDYVKVRAYATVIPHDEGESQEEAMRKAKEEGRILTYSLVLPADRLLIADVEREIAKRLTAMKEDLEKNLFLMNEGWQKRE